MKKMIVTLMAIVAIGISTKTTAKAATVFPIVRVVVRPPVIVRPALIVRPARVVVVAPLPIVRPVVVVRRRVLVY